MVMVWSLELSFTVDICLFYQSKIKIAQETTMLNLLYPFRNLKKGKRKNKAKFKPENFPFLKQKHALSFWGECR